MVRASPMAQQVKECRKHRRHGFDPWKRKWQPIPGFLSENPKQEEPGGLVHRVTKGWTQTKHTIWFDNRDISRNKEVTRAALCLGFYPDFSSYSTCIFFQSQDAKRHFATMTLYLPSHVTGFWFSLTFKRGSQVSWRKSPSCLTPQRWSVLLRGRIPRDSWLGCEPWPLG